MSLDILFHFLCTQHVSGINISIIGTLRLRGWIATLVVLFVVRCVLEIWCGWFWVVSVLQAARILLKPSRTTSPTHNVCNTESTQAQPHQISNTQRIENKTTDVVIQQHSRKLLILDILMSETCWVHKKWHQVGLLLFNYYSTMMHGPIKIRLKK